MKIVCSFAFSLIAARRSDGIAEGPGTLRMQRNVKGVVRLSE